jgi:glycosyltransferase involved in cell wall biosynthesis
VTGTAVNPLLRAAHLYRRTQQLNTATANTNGADTTSWVTLVIPWLELAEDQQELYQHVFENQQEQEEYIRNWLRDSAKMEDAADGLNLVFYPARYHSGLGSVFAMGDIISLLPPHELDVCLLEEPEHVNWFRAPGDGWTKRYKYVVGIVHTNYQQYANAHYSGLWTAPAISLISSAMVRAYCHKVIKLSDVLQTFAPEKESTSNVHGVRGDFLPPMTSMILGMPLDDDDDDGNHVVTLETTTVSAPTATKVSTTTHDNEEEEEEDASNTQRIYFIGKLLWAKGLDLLLELEEYTKELTGEYFPITVYGSGPDQKEIARAFLGRKQAVKEEEGNTRTPGKRKGKKQNDEQKPSKKTKDLLVKAFAWANRRRWTSTNTNSKQQPPSKSSTMDDDYQTISESAKESFETARETLKRKVNNYGVPKLFSKDAVKAQLEKMADELPKTLYELRKHPIPSTFPGRIDHAQLKLGQHDIFVNPSMSEVLCTTTAEALAMGKFAIIPVHPSNTFFLKFPNCLGYRNKLEFVANLRWALTHHPLPLTKDFAREFTWEAATDRLVQAAAITHQEAWEREQLGRSKIDERIAWFHNEAGKGTKGDILRKVLGAGPVSQQYKYGVTQNNSRSESGDEDDQEEEGLSRKFRESSFVEAIRTATKNGLSSFR